jgi:hypothetical protein
VVAVVSGFCNVAFLNKFLHILSRCRSSTARIASYRSLVVLAAVGVRDILASLYPYDLSFE